MAIATGQSDDRLANAVNLSTTTINLVAGTRYSIGESFGTGNTFTDPVSGAQVAPNMGNYVNMASCTVTYFNGNPSQTFGVDPANLGGELWARVLQHDVLSNYYSEDTVGIDIGRWP